jgi:hypothetical protein
MMGRLRSFTVSLLLIALAALAAGCNGGDTPSPSPTATPEETATPTPTETPVPDIRDEDLSQHPALQDLLAAGGEVDASRIIYVDLTEDGVDDAIVPISSGGTGGDLVVVVLGYGPDGLGELLRALPQEARSIRATVEDGQLVTTEGVYGPDDPFCCPSQVLTTTYRWDGSALVVELEERR